MADETPQLKDTQPILSPIKVESEAEGYNAFAKTLGNIATTAGEKTAEIVSDQSNAMLMTSVSQVQTAKTNSQIEMIKHPDQAGKIANNTADTLDSITKNAFVNTKDRQKLKSIASDDFNDIRLKSAEVEFQQSKKSSAIMYWDNYNQISQGINDALLSGDLKKAKALEDTLHQASASAVQMDVISAEQYGKITKANFDLYNKAEYITRMAGNPEGHSAADYHSAMQSPFSGGNFDNVNYPVNVNTQHLSKDYNFDRSMAGQYNALYNDKPINAGVVSLAQDHEFEEFSQQMAGVHRVKGEIHSGTPFSQIDARMKFYEGQQKLSPSQTGEYNYWKAFKNQMQHGDGFLNLMTQTSLGGQYTQEYNQTAVAIRDSTKTPEEKFNAIRDNDNAYIGHMAALGQSQHLDPNYIRPVPSQYVNEVQSSFVKDAPVGQAIARIAYIKPEYRAYLANTMQKPNQAVSVYLAGTTMDKTDTTFQAQLIEANQDRDYSSLLKSGKEATQNANIWDDISSNSTMKSIYGYLGKLPGGDTPQTGLRQAATNYVLYRAAKEGDVNLNGKSKYEQDFIDNVSKGFNFVQGNNYTFDGNSLNLRKADMDFIANYALADAYKNIHQGKSEADFQSYIDLHPLQVTNTPDGRIVVIDKDGHSAQYTKEIKDKNGKVVDHQLDSAFDHPYTSDMLAYAHKHVEETKKSMVSGFTFQPKSMERINHLMNSIKKGNPIFPASEGE